MNEADIQVRVFEESFDLKRAFTISRGSRTQAHVLRVSLSDGQHEGHGECVPYARYDETMASVSASIEEIADRVTHDRLSELLPAGAARNALDCAFWDLKAKAAGCRVWELLSSSKPSPVVTAYTLSLDDPEKMRAQAAENAYRPLLKIKLGTADDMVRLEAVRAGAPTSQIIVDANEGWSAEIYKDLSPHLKRIGVGLVEQPLPAGDDDMLAEIDRIIPVCADESCHDRASLPDLVGKYDVINIKLDKTGGLTEALALKTAAQSAGYGVMVGCMVGTSLAMAPATILAQDVAYTDLDGPLLLAEDRDNALFYDDGGVHAPDERLWG